MQQDSRVHKMIVFLSLFKKKNYKCIYLCCTLSNSGPVNTYHTISCNSLHTVFIKMLTLYCLKWSVKLWSLNRVTFPDYFRDLTIWLDNSFDSLKRESACVTNNVIDSSVWVFRWACMNNTRTWNRHFCVECWQNQCYWLHLCFSCCVMSGRLQWPHRLCIYHLLQPRGDRYTNYRQINEYGMNGPLN